MRRRGFTLVELLVVIGVIALLIALLLPALNRARQHADAVHCLARMRQVGAAASMYGNENKQFMPQQMNWHIPATDADSWVYKLQPYLREYEVFTCTNAEDFGGNDRSRPMMTTLYNAWVSGAFYGGMTLKITRARPASERVLFADHGPLSNGSWIIIDLEGGYTYGWHWWYPHHQYSLSVPGKMRTVCFADGHVETVERGSLQQWQLTWGPKP